MSIKSIIRRACTEYALAATDFSEVANVRYALPRHTIRYILQNTNLLERYTGTPCFSTLVDCATLRWLCHNQNRAVVILQHQMLRESLRMLPCADIARIAKAHACYDLIPLYATSIRQLTADGLYNASSDDRAIPAFVQYVDIVRRGGTCCVCTIYDVLPVCNVSRFVYVLRKVRNDRAICPECQGHMRGILKDGIVRCLDSSDTVVLCDVLSMLELDDDLLWGIFYAGAASKASGVFAYRFYRNLTRGMTQSLMRAGLLYLAMPGDWLREIANYHGDVHADAADRLAAILRKYFDAKTRGDVAAIVQQLPLLVSKGLLTQRSR